MRKDIEAGHAFVRMTLQDNAFIKSLARNGERLKAFGKGMAKFGAVVTAAGTAVTGALTAALYKFAATGDALDKSSKRTGVAASALAELGFAAEQSGARLEVVEKGLFGLSRSLFDAERGGKKVIESLKLIGLSMSDLEGLSPEQQFEKVAAGLANIADESKRGAVAQALLGRAGRQLLPMFADLAALRQEARDLGIVPEDDAVQAAAEVTGAFNRIRRVASAVVFEVGAAFAPTFLSIAKKVVAVSAAVAKWVRANKELFVTIGSIAAGVVAAGTAITGLGLTLFGVGVAMKGLVTGLAFVGSVLGIVLSPLGLIATALAAGIYLWSQYTESGKTTVSGLVSLFGELWATAKETFGGIADALAVGDLALAGQIAMTGLRVAFLQGLDALSNAVGGAVGDMLGTIGTQLAGGDLSGAFATLTSGLYDVWANFSEGLVAVWTTTMRAVTAAWEKTTHGISDWILKNATEGGIIGKLALLGTGVDMEAEAKRAKELDAKLKARGVDTGPGFLEGAQQTARDQLSATANAFRTKLDQLDANAQAQTKAANQDRKSVV